MRAAFSLTVAEGKRLIAKGIKKHPAVAKAFKEGIVVIAGGTTNGYIVEELTGREIEREWYTAGVITPKGQCVTDPGRRIPPVVLERGQVSELSWQDALEKMGRDDVFLKGANAIDAEGFAGIITSDSRGGTIGRAYPLIRARGIRLIIPVGLEKMVPSVRKAAELTGIYTIDKALGQKFGYTVIGDGEIFTEISALKLLFPNIEVVVVGSGGIGGAEGGKTFIVEGNEDEVVELLSLIKTIKGEPALKDSKRNCPCDVPCDRIRN
ncbi:hypothetical protein [Carboxydothermus hydrogenoformans]|uniref:Uncharacterized protein n=1 Tax=Carboxydothermus hydrogenoformans (strain ATCC BAA-161 / DSM 6008 / Z-2901) TaxID=246194 RepID=Q3AB65_CARHZ|nr:hypothetical protein [Carboxydothermus hydrogenoformans]ABB15422.1 conserved hypothetical protein [Carboxydothermus hydrogenoformans Z-2901]